MDWHEFLKVYVPSLIAVVFVVAVLPGSGGVAQMSGGHAGFQGLVAIAGYLGGAVALPLIIFSFGIGAVAWMVVYLFKADRPSYLRFVKNTLFVFAALFILVYGLGKEEENVSPQKESTISSRERTESEAVEKKEKVVRDENELESLRPGNTAETWRETALWKMTAEQELLKWISKNETVRVIEGGGSHYKVEHEGDVGFVRKENIKPSDR